MHLIREFTGIFTKKNEHHFVHGILRILGSQLISFMCLYIFALLFLLDAVIVGECVFLISVWEPKDNIAKTVCVCVHEQNHVVQRMCVCCSKWFMVFAWCEFGALSPFYLLISCTQLIEYEKEENTYVTNFLFWFLIATDWYTTDLVFFNKRKKIWFAFQPSGTADENEKHIIGIFIACDFKLELPNEISYVEAIFFLFFSKYEIGHLHQLLSRLTVRKVNLFK